MVTHPDMMQFCRKEDIHQFMGLPDTTELTELLDQVFANLYACYSNEKDQVFDGEKVNQEEFICRYLPVFGMFGLQKSHL